MFKECNNLVENKFDANLITPVSSIRLLKKFYSAEIIKVIVLETGDGTGGGEEVVNVIPFTNADLINGELVKLHGLNRRVVSVTVTDPQGIEFSSRVNNLNDSTRVLIDLTRFGEIQGTWYLTIR